MTADTFGALLACGSTGPRPLFPGAVLGLDVAGDRRIWTVGVTRAYADASGTPLPEAVRVPVVADTLYDLASITKLVTATVVLTLVERGLLDLDEPACRRLPELRGEDRRDVTVRQLLSHTAGLPADTGAWRDQSDLRARQRAVLATPLLDAPGTTYRYSCVGYLLLGLLVEQVAGPLDVVVQREVADPLELTGLGYRPLDRGIPRDRIAATEVRPVSWSSLVSPDEADTRGVVHDENAASWDGVAGNAGLFATAADLLGFGRGLLDRLAGRPSPLPLAVSSARAMVTDQAPGLGAGFGVGLGWRVDDPTFLGALAGRGRAYGHTGFTGTSLVVDEDRDLVAVLLTNRVHPSRTWTDLSPFRRALAAELAGLTARPPGRSDGR